MQKDTEADDGWREEILYGDSEARVQIVRGKPTKTDPFVDGGFVDGSCATYELRKGRKVVGVEILVTSVGGLGLVLRLVIAQIKLWLWMEIHRVLREVKRVELLLVSHPPA